ncbi:hypothetical protein [Roseospirillum parvum]|uniref:Uncharacterized protein n=1 Tax=Roseospirillum parvum TaxID=83401 RepID=A0A1G8GGI3_9PROT|nr:hypothetical protein [Roseospirillum parvum]SDH93493.1 hypothetical protein SAMN05421742_1274 [Roseospirillum parvum]
MTPSDILPWISIASVAINALLGLAMWGIRNGFASKKELHGLERSLLEMKADMPLHYVRREDYVRNQTVIESKLDALALHLQQMKDRHGQS